MENQTLRDELLHENAKTFINELEADTRVDKHADEILKTTEEEIELGLAHGFESKADLDALFGEGCWRPLPRHVIEQDDKWRPIDDAKKG